MGKWGHWIKVRGRGVRLGDLRFILTLGASAFIDKETFKEACLYVF